MDAGRDKPCPYRAGTITEAELRRLPDLPRLFDADNLCSHTSQF